MTEFREYDCVKAIHDLENVPIGTEGTVLIIYNPDYFEVEFMDEEGVTLNVLTTHRNNLQKISENIDD